MNVQDILYFMYCYRNEEFYTDIATTIDASTKEILDERNEVLRQLEEIEEAQKQVMYSKWSHTGIVQ